MQTATISIVYQSQFGNTATVAQMLMDALSSDETLVHLLEVKEAKRKMNLLHQSDTIIFGSPTYFGNVSAEFKKFMEATLEFWYKQPWRNKLAAGFTVSSTCNGDKLNTLIGLSLFAAQHGMIWISQGILPRFINDEQTDGQNRLASYLGLMVQSAQAGAVAEFHPGDLLTIELFARRILDVTQLLKTIKQQSYDKNTD